MDVSICISFIDCNSEYISQTYFYLPFISYPTPYVLLVTIHDRLSLVQSISNTNYIHTYIHYYYFYTKPLLLKTNTMISKIKLRKKWTVLPEGRASVLCSWNFQLVRCAFSSFLKRPSAWISLILAEISFQAFKAEQ